MWYMEKTFECGTAGITNTTANFFTGSISNGFEWWNDRKIGGKILCFSQNLVVMISAACSLPNAFVASTAE